MAKQQFAVCALGPRWQFLPPQGTCEKHKPAPPEVVQSRLRWLSAWEKKP
jgi:hypothetical protein